MHEIKKATYAGQQESYVCMTSRKLRMHEARKLGMHEHNKLRMHDHKKATYA